MVLTNISKLRGALSVIAIRSTNKRVDKARKSLCEEIIHDTENFVPYDTENFVPYDTGKLSSSATILDNGKQIAYTADYAEYVNEMPESNNFDRSSHTQATSHWLDASIALNRDKWLNNFKERIGGR